MLSRLAAGAPAGRGAGSPERAQAAAVSRPAPTADPA
ncbi:hypothetical protein GA0115240_14721, partial [Streptomyces sp. DvalAA-14]